MPIDASIVNQLRPMQLESPMAQAGGVLNLLGLLQQQKLREAQMGEMQRKAAQETEMRNVLAKLPPDADHATVLGAIRPYMGANQLGTMLTSSADRQSRDRNTAQIAMARLAQQAQRDATDALYKSRTATTQEERLHWQQQVDVIEQHYKRQAAEIAAGRYTYDTGATIAPFRGPSLTLPQPAAPANPAAPVLPPNPVLRAQEASTPTSTLPPAYSVEGSPEQTALNTLLDWNQRGGRGTVALNDPSTIIPARAEPNTLDRWDRQQPQPREVSNLPLALGPDAAPAAPGPAAPPPLGARNRPFTISDAPKDLSPRDKALWVRDRERERNKPPSQSEVRDREKAAQAHRGFAAADALITHIQTTVGKDPTVVGAAGMARRVYEGVSEQIPGMQGVAGTTATDISTKLKLLQSTIYRELVGSGQLSAGDYKHINDIIRGQGVLDSAQATHNALEEVRTFLKTKLPTAPTSPGGRPRAEDFFRSN